jgi:hypothetical protein
VKGEASVRDIQNDAPIVRFDVDVGKFFQFGARNLAALGRRHGYTITEDCDE